MIAEKIFEAIRDWDNGNDTHTRSARQMATHIAEALTAQDGETDAEIAKQLIEEFENKFPEEEHDLPTLWTWLDRRGI